MNALHAELALARSTATAALRVLAELRPEAALFGFDQCLPKEMKTASDRILEEVIVASLSTTGMDILSEESGLISGGSVDSLRWIVDPLDGTVNFMRGLAPCSVSLALCQGDVPVLGVVGEYPSGKIAWGGEGQDSFLSDIPIRVSGVIDKQQGVICTGFPSRFEFDEEGVKWIASTFAPYAKVRMLGSASLSLLHVARGGAEVYSERDIMIWDVAAGLAILQGAGGYFSMTKGEHAQAYNVFASNGLILES
jgi:myo-inositol-1(or 4)-monophosphatase